MENLYSATCVQQFAFLKENFFVIIVALFSNFELKRDEMAQKTGKTFIINVS
jgi:hypothetical protein